MHSNNLRNIYTNSLLKYSSHPCVFIRETVTNVVFFHCCHFFILVILQLFLCFSSDKKISNCMLGEQLNRELSQGVKLDMPIFSKWHAQFLIFSKISFWQTEKNQVTVTLFVRNFRRNIVFVTLSWFGSRAVVKLDYYFWSYHNTYMYTNYISPN